MYADDIVVLSRGLRAEQEAQDALDEINIWTVNQNIRLNPTKCQAMTMKLNTPNEPLRIRRQLIPYSKTIKYLGITNDNKLSWAAQVKQIRLKSNALTKLCRATSHAHTLGRKLYKEIVRATLKCGVAVMSTMKATNKMRYITARTILLKRLLGLPIRSKNTPTRRTTAR